MVMHRYLKQDNSIKRKVVSRFSLLLLTAGSLLLFWSFYPIISFEIFARLFIQKQIVSPVPTSLTASSIKTANSVLGSWINLSSNLRDFTQVSRWFPDKPQQNLDTNKIKINKYLLSIPKLNINQAIVTVGGDDLTKSLVHYLPTSLPGEYGNVVIFGHSTLSQLYNVKDYKTIFTFLPSLDPQNHDLIELKVGDLNYQYEVIEMFVVDTEEISVLEQKYDASYLTLITCVPPGTYFKRLVVRAKLIKLPISLVE